ncbi:MAG: hypothetical protein DCF19_22650 [Pseudanabaena frigida]|uniref:DUF4168 domain-containing protein n=1 Tax=Pseudanabaena frigida TaxID=945775 RepID=A0A2W4VUH0_9CYAN|nr:MAG: hypothetical protein DCF19_22650 [Pseudanabaena frigida]
MNIWYQRHSSYFLNNYLKRHLNQRLGTISLFGLCMLIGAIADPKIMGDRVLASAETCTRASSLQNFLTKVTLGEDRITRYASAVNAIENKRLEIFRVAKSNPDWSNIASLAESQQTKVCDLSQRPEFLQNLCNQLRSYSEEEICRYGFTNKEFNQITLEQMQNAKLRSQIQDKQMQLRGNK